ncbi:GrpE nucleotide exchange factor [Tanacetum coccineum]
MAALPLSNLCTPSRIVHQTPFRTSNLAYKPRSYKPICGFPTSLTNSYLGQNWASFKPICASKNTTLEVSSSILLGAINPEVVMATNRKGRALPGLSPCGGVLKSRGLSLACQLSTFLINLLVQGLRPVDRASISVLTYTTSISFHQWDALEDFPKYIINSDTQLKSALIEWKTSEDEAEIDDLEESESDAEQDSILTVKSLLQLYKQAVLTEDDTTASDIEATLSHLENEKNMLLEKVAALSTDTSSGKERLIRLQADFENFRKRSEKERLNVRSDAQGEVIESLLPMVDNFERAKQQLKLETDQEKKIDASYQGIYKQFVEIMRSLRVAVVPTVGKAFDPAIHEAIAREESKEFNEGIVMEEFRRGFILGERLLRPAMVKVSAGPGRPKSDGSASEASTDSNEQPQTADLGQ